MTDIRIGGKTAGEWEAEFPLLQELISTREVLWLNSRYEAFESGNKQMSINESDIRDAEERLRRFARYIRKAFPETERSEGIIESRVVPIPSMKQALEAMADQTMDGRFLLKCDSHLPISGSIKARGGIYEVLKHAEDLLLQHRLLTVNDDYSVLARDYFRNFFARYSISVGSTGNLGLSIGIISAKLGFQVTVHMSSDAKQWKKDLLRSKGARVVEHSSDYSAAVEQGRRQAESDPDCYFIDDENSRHLFLGYSVAALRLQKQLEDLNITVDEDHPLFVYLPCGVGGGPGGVAFGLKWVYGNHVHCFFAEPTHSPCMLLGMMTGLHDNVSVQDFGIDNVTEADGLAVGRPSGFVGRTIEPFLSGIYTVNDDNLHQLLRGMADTENIRLEPSALAGVYGPIQLLTAPAGKQYLNRHALEDKLKNATHLAWATGGGMVPEVIMDEYYRKGLELSL
ncbi:D-serine ammonia-lyase [Paenibacillus beijingensis]|uniref:Probable D-serine dehydratase n=1 Tax=Paenibacillus beijingensis TaxID=1126833 RepID=A0A0D5NNU0_9BACL|nr:D-serine ammonia-lyase [Paenibacillus beijingensis]AJY76820.1 serine ammonia-lyase [Paenibacillus beijingensis]